MSAELLKRDGEMANHLIDISGRRFGHLTAEQRQGQLYGKPAWLCHCDCGATVLVSGAHLREGATQSCSQRCANLVHGHASPQTPTYRSWASMLRRCYNKKDINYKRYGGRGITVCLRWRTFKHFLDDMGIRPDGLSLDRTNNDGNYEPGNCKWSTRKEQNNNQRGRI